jgi:hypothetical protein
VLGFPERAPLLAILIGFPNMTSSELNLNDFTVTTFCPFCKEDHKVSFSRLQLESDTAMVVYCMRSKERWPLTPQEKEKIRKGTTESRNAEAARD